MSLPTPNTRKEQYLNAIATGNASGLPTPITREEEYLDAIAKSGGGGSGDGDMKKSVYDSDLAVSGVGGIKAFVNSAVAGKVDKVEGKGLSTNDYSDTEKGKVADNTAAIEAIVNVNGCCNILDNNLPSETTTTITWTVNADKTVTASSGGQSVSGLEHHEINHSYTLQPGTYKLSGGVDSNNYIELLETNYASTGIIDTGNGYEFTVASAHTYIVLLRSGNGVVNAVFKPMIHDARLNPTGYVPYAMTNEQLTERVQIVPFTLPNDISSKSIGDTVEIPIHHPGDTYLFTAFTLSVFSQNRTVDGCFEQIAVSSTNLYLVGLKQTFSSSYNGATGYLTFVKV